MRQLKGISRSGLMLVGLTLGVLWSGVASADTLHFLNGKIVRGKLDRVTGDIIEFREKSGYGSKINIHRIELTNRRDVVETRGDKRYFGEIVYFDRFKLDIRTSTGLIKLNRLMITNVVVGTPAERPVSNTDVMPLAPTAASTLKSDKPMVHFPAGYESLPNTAGTNSSTGFNTDGEDGDVMPAVNR